MHSKAIAKYYIFIINLFLFFLLYFINITIRQSESGISIEYLRNLSKFQSEWVDRERARGVPVFSSTLFFQATSKSVATPEKRHERELENGMKSEGMGGREDNDRLVDGVIDFILDLK